MNKKPTIDARAYLKNHFPGFFLLLGGNSLVWPTVNKVHTRAFQENMTRFKKLQKPFRVEASLFDIIHESEKGDPEAIRTFQYIKNLFTQLTELTTSEEKKWLARNIEGLVTNTNKNYLNFLGELSVLNFLKQQKQLTLLQTERPLFPEKPKGTKIDFDFLNRETNTIWPVEIVNLHLKKENACTEEAIHHP